MIKPFILLLIVLYFFSVLYLYDFILQSFSKMFRKAVLLPCTTKHLREFAWFSSDCAWAIKTTLGLCIPFFGVGFRLCGGALNDLLTGSACYVYQWALRLAKQYQDFNSQTLWLPSKTFYTHCTPSTVNYIKQYITYISVALHKWGMYNLSF